MEALDQLPPKRKDKLEFTGNSRPGIRIPGPGIPEPREFHPEFHANEAEQSNASEADKHAQLVVD